MNLVPSGMGAISSRTKVLIGVLVVLVAVFFLTRNSDPAGPAASSTVVNTPAPLSSPGIAQVAPVITRADASSGPPLPMPPTRGAQRGGDSIQDFRPTLKLPEGTDVSRVDPEVRLDLLAKMRTLAPEGGRRSLFEFGTAAPVAAIPKVAPIKPAKLFVGPVAPPAPAAPVVPVKPAPPPIPLKFYGYINGRGADAMRSVDKRAFFLDGEDIVVAGENDLIRSRFRVLRIDLNSAVVEDTTTKSQQTLPLVAEVPG